MSKKQKYSKGDLVQVTEYYHDLIAKSSYVGIITDVKKYQSGVDELPRDVYVIYEVLDMQTNEVKTAEDFAIMPLRGR